MKKFYVAAWIVVCFSIKASSQNAVIDSSKLPQTFPHYLDELTFDTPSDEQAWTKLSAGLHAAFASTDELYFRREVPSDNIADNIFDSKKITADVEKGKAFIELLSEK